jgi:hypothetical protein
VTLKAFTDTTRDLEVLGVRTRADLRRQRAIVQTSGATEHNQDVSGEVV